MKINTIVMLTLFIFVTGCTTDDYLNRNNRIIDSTSTHTLSISIISIDCSQHNQTTNQTQVDFKGVLPGKTTQAEVIEILGKPNDTYFSSDGTILTYNGFDVNLKNNVVSEIYDVKTTIKPNDLIVQFGCPEVIAITPGEYDIETATFGYPSIGLFLDTIDLPLTSESKIFFVYIPPMNSVDEFIESEYMKNLGEINIVTWEEIIK